MGLMVGTRKMSGGGTVTKTTIESALGYTPVKEEDVVSKVEEILEQNEYVKEVDLSDILTRLASLEARVQALEDTDFTVEDYN